jgi:hypothetical protein
MFWLAVVLATIAVLIVAALALPVSLEIEVELADRLRGHAHLRWLLGIVHVTLGGNQPRVIAAAASHAEEATAAPAKAKKPVKRKPARGGRRIIAVLRTGLMDRLIQLWMDLVHQIHIDRFMLHARYGLDDPADTGQLCGVLVPLHVFATVKRLDVRLTPDFDQPIAAGTFSGAISVRPLSVIGLLVAFVSSPPAWRAFRAWRRTS